MDEKKINAVNDSELDEVAGGATNYDYYGNPIGGSVPIYVPPVVPAQPVQPVNPGLNFSFANDIGATYVCPSCGNTKFKIVSADKSKINLKCKRCSTTFSVANN